jgi:peroxiredoxin Q/BCP
MEGQGFRDRAPEFESAGVAILGASFDPPEVNRAFADANGLPFPLLSDVDTEVGKRYETKRAPEEPSPEFAKRRTYLIDPELRIARAYRVSDIPAHPAQILEDLRALGAIPS